jgi:hypothetical protein
MKMRHNILRVKHFRSFRFGKIHLTILLPVIFMFSGCTFIENYFTKKEKTIEFMDALMSNHFKKCVSMMPLEMHPAINKDTMEIETSRFKAKLDSIFGSEWKINFLSVDNRVFTSWLFLGLGKCILPTTFVLTESF